MSPATATYAPDGRYAWIRLVISLVLAVVGGIGLWLAVVALPTIQQEFGLDRAGASMTYTATVIGFAKALAGQESDIGENEKLQLN